MLHRARTLNPDAVVAAMGCYVETGMEKLKADGSVEFYQSMGLSLTFDHRAVDGAPAAKFLKELCGALENFDLLLAK